MHEAFFMARCFASHQAACNCTLVTCRAQTSSAHLLQGNIMFSNEHSLHDIRKRSGKRHGILCGCNSVARADAQVKRRLM
jgi:hypothetical protein